MKIDSSTLITFTFDSLVQNIYINGILDQTTTLSSSKTLGISNYLNYYIGYNNNLNYPFYLNSVIDDIKIYNRALTASEVLQLANPVTTSVDNQISKSVGLQIYPNPATSLVSVSYNNQSVDQIEVLDAICVSVLKVSNVSEVNVSSLPKGTYFIKAKIGNKIVVEKLIVR